MTINFHQINYFIRHFFVAKRRGHGIHSPFAYQLCEEVFYNSNAFYDFKRLSALRKHLLTNESELSIEDFGAGSKTFKTTTRKIKDLAAKGISTPQQSEILYKLMNFLKCRNAIELGTSLGLNTLYMAQVNKSARIVTIEGSESLFHAAKDLAKTTGTTHIEFIHGLFDAALPEVLKQIPELDLLYVDGNHTKEATLRYFHMALEKKHNHSVFIFDDIYWSSEMTEAWQEIKHHPFSR